MHVKKNKNIQDFLLVEHIGTPYGLKKQLMSLNEYTCRSFSRKSFSFMYNVHIKLG